MLTEAVGEDIEDTDIASMLERLAARLGIKEGGEDETDETTDNADSAAEIHDNSITGKKEGDAVQ